MQTIQEFFMLGMDRNLPDIIPLSFGEKVLNLSCGNKKIANTIPVDYPEWDADTMPLPFDDESVDGIHAYHCFEHYKDPVKVLLECQRVLRPFGVVQICVPYYSSAMAHHDLDHKKFFTEDTFRNLFRTEYYDKNKIEWKFEIGFNLICGIVERNLCLLTQLIKAKA